MSKPTDRELVGRMVQRTRDWLGTGQDADVPRLEIAGLASIVEAVLATPPATDQPVASNSLARPRTVKPLAEMTLGEKQRTFTVMVARLILQAEAMGYQVTWGDAYRDPRVHGEQGVRKSYSAANSAHKNRLAVDLNLFRRGKFLSRTEDHQPLGEWWEAQGGTWGGRWQDGNHYSLEHRGVK